METTLTITHPDGLHARPAAKLCLLARRFKSTTITVQNLSRPAQLTPKPLSPFNLILLEAGQGDQVRFQAEGEDAEAAIAAITDLVTSNFGEEA